MGLRHIGDVARALAVAEKRAIGWPSIRTAPANGGRMPSSVLSSVDLPLPLGPSSASTSPCAER